MKTFFSTSLIFLFGSLLLTSCSNDDAEAPSAQIVAIEPTMGPVGVQVLISGENFGADISQMTVLFNGQEAAITSGSETQLTVIVPEGATSGALSLQNASGAVEGPRFVVLQEEVEIGEFVDTDGLISLATGFEYEGGYRLTSSNINRTGVVYYGNKLNVENGFETTFDFRISSPGGILDGEGKTGADGLAFLIQNQSADAIGNQGGSIGYSNIKNSLAIEFDTFANTPGSDYNNGETNGNHISVQTNGKEANNPAIRFSIGYNDQIPELMDGEVHSAKVVYEANNLMVYLDDFTTPAIDIEVDLSDLLDLDEGRAYVGFSSSTGQSYANHDILNWTFTPKK